MERPFISIFWDRKRDEYSIQPFTKGPVAWTAFGDPTLISGKSFSAEIYDAVMHNLNLFGKQQFVQEKAKRLSRDEKLSFLSTHLEVSIEQATFDELLVRPLRRERGGRVGYDEGSKIITVKDAPRVLAAAILEAFERST